MQIGGMRHTSRMAPQPSGRLRALFEAGLALTSELSLDAVLRRVIASASELTGFVVLASSRTRLDVNWEVNDLLRTAGSQAAGFLAQMQATEALLEARLRGVRAATRAGDAVLTGTQLGTSLPSFSTTGIASRL